jgi:hypothetical protein
MLKIITFIFLSFITTVEAKVTALLTVPLNDGGKHYFAIDLKDKCSFNNVTEIFSPDIIEEDEGNVVVDKLNHVQKKIALEIEEQKITEDLITFTLKGSQNVRFEYSFLKCKLQKVITFNDKKYVMDSLDVEYDKSLGSPVVQKINILDKDKKVIETLYPSQLQKQIASYEFIFGPVVNTYTNIRYANQKKFLKNHPVIKPIPGFLFRYGPIFLNKDGLGSLVYNSGDFTAIILGVLKGEAMEAPGLSERTQSLFLGGILKYSFLEFTYYNDFFKDKGYNAKLNFTKSFHQFLQWKMTPSAYVQYFDDKYVDYYFGVTPTESQTSGLKAYQGKHTINYGINFEVNYIIERWTILGNIGEKWYGNSVHSSPTVVKRNETRGVLGILYKFF